MIIIIVVVIIVIQTQMVPLPLFILELTCLCRIQIYILLLEKRKNRREAYLLFGNLYFKEDFQTMDDNIWIQNKMWVLILIFVNTNIFICFYYKPTHVIAISIMLIPQLNKTFFRWQVDERHYSSVSED